MPTITIEVIPAVRSAGGGPGGKLYDGDMAKVTKAVGGIHPPAIDRAGALYMTKGELRYVANIGARGGGEGAGFFLRRLEP